MLGHPSRFLGIARRDSPKMGCHLHLQRTHLSAQTLARVLLLPELMPADENFLRQVDQRLAGFSTLSPVFYPELEVSKEMGPA